MHETSMHDDPRARVARVLAETYRELAGIAIPERPRFSVARMLSEMATDRGLHDGFESEVVGVAALTAGRARDPHRVVIPWSALARGEMQTTSGPTGGYLVSTEAPSAVDVLRPWSVTVSAGMTVVENLASPQAVPRVSTAPTGAWHSDELGTGSTESTPALAQISIGPKTYGALVDYSLTFARSARSAEGFLRAQLLAAAGSAIDKAVFNGSGAAGQPLGLLNVSGIASQLGTSLAWSGLLNMLKATATAGANDARVAFVSTPAVRELLQQREAISTSGRFLWDNDRIANRPAYATPDMPAATMLAGDYALALLALWGPGIEVAVNPFGADASAFRSGIAQARVLVSCDVAALQPGAFIKSSAIT